MTYKVRRIYGYDVDGKAIEARRSEFIDSPVPLNVGGAEFLRPHKFYRIVELVTNVRE